MERMRVLSYEFNKVGSFTMFRRDESDSGKQDRRAVGLDARQ